MSLTVQQDLPQEIDLIEVEPTATLQEKKTLYFHKFTTLQVHAMFQGSIVDRIDHNVETAHIRVDDGLQQLKKAERHQRKNLKMRCILGLAATLIFLVLVLFAKLAAS